VDDAERVDRQQEFERLKLAVESVKHITTLATGSIVLIATFADKVPLALFVSGRRYFLGAILSLTICVMLSFSLSVCLNASRCSVEPGNPK
jgi:hypothetical protein